MPQGRKALKTEIAATNVAIKTMMEKIDGLIATAKDEDAKAKILNWLDGDIKAVEKLREVKRTLEFSEDARYVAHMVGLCYALAQCNELRGFGFDMDSILRFAEMVNGKYADRIEGAKLTKMKTAIKRMKQGGDVLRLKLTDDEK